MVELALVAVVVVVAVFLLFVRHLLLLFFRLSYVNLRLKI